MRRGAVGETADELEDADLVEISSPPLPSSVIGAYLLTEALSEVDQPFRVNFTDFFEEGDPDVYLRPGAHGKIYELSRSLGVELPELRVAASLAYGLPPEPEFVDNALARGSLEKSGGPAFRGEIGDALESSLSPYFEGLTGDSIETGNLLNDLGIPIDLDADDLDGHEESRLASYLALHLVEHGASPPSVDLLIGGGLSGREGPVEDIALKTEALCHGEGPSRALAGLMSGREQDERVERYVSEAVRAVEDCESWEGEVFRFFRIENGPALKAMKVARRDLCPGEPVAVGDGVRTYCSGPRSAPLTQTGVEVLDTGEWFVTEASPEELEDLY